jgi:hypothetical protein
LSRNREVGEQKARKSFIQGANSAVAVAVEAKFWLEEFTCVPAESFV